MDGIRKGKAAKQFQEELCDKMDRIIEERRQNIGNEDIIKSELQSDAVNSDSSQEEESNIEFNREEIPDLWDSGDWQRYYARLKQVHTQVIDKKGWPGFSRVFMVSAINGDGVEDIKVNISLFLVI